MDKREDKYLLPFMEYYNTSGRGRAFGITERDVKSGAGDFDYLITDKKNEYAIPLEVKQIIDRPDREAWARYGHNTNRQKKAIEKILPRDFSGSYLVSLKRNYKVNEPEADRAARQILDAISNKLSEIIILNRFPAEIKKINDSDKNIYFSTSFGGFIDPPGTIHANIKDKITTANRQLNYATRQYKIIDQILLLVNQYEYASPYEVTRALSESYDNLLKCINIDSIYFQWWSPDNKEAFHKKIYTRKFLTEFDAGRLDFNDNDNICMLNNWYVALSKKDDRVKDRLFSATKSLLKDDKAYKYFTTVEVREEITRLGIWLVEQKRFDDAKWLVERLIDDPNPSEPDAGDDDIHDELRYHKEILEGKEPGIITGVKCHLAWVVQKLAVHKQTIEKAFDYTQELLKTKNLYVVEEAIVPLIEITARRQWLSATKQNKLKKLLFSLLNKYGKYSAIANYLTHAFNFVKDISADEAYDIVSKLDHRDNEDLAVLLIYFSIFRPHHFKDNKEKEIREYNPVKIIGLLTAYLKSDASEHQDLRGSVAWNFWRLLQNEPEQFDKIKEYIDLLYKSNYSRNTFDHLMRIVEENIDKHYPVCIVWLRDLIKQAIQAVNQNEDSIRLIWISVPQSLSILAKNEPAIYINIASDLYQLWEKGVYIGEIKHIFESYQYIEDESSKKKIINELKKIYEEMKKRNPKLVAVNWGL